MTAIAGQPDAEVLLVKEGGTFSERNSQHPSEAVRIDDMITEVNGIAVDEVYEIAIRELHKASRLRLTLLRDVMDSGGEDDQHSASPRQVSPRRATSAVEIVRIAQRLRAKLITEPREV